MKIKAIYPGTFDPITFGHEDLVKRASNIFEGVIVAVACNTQKQTLFSSDERYEMCKEVLKKYKNVDVIKLNKLTVEHAEDLGAKIMLRGLRAVSDFEYEVQLSNLNRTMNPNIESIFLSPDEKYSFISSSIIKDIARHQGDLTKFLDKTVAERLKEKLS
ncbi:MAG: pantetheine-phosphate adenylyltransferase [Gammaproteobacteria bacterium]